MSANNWWQDDTLVKLPLTKKSALYILTRWFSDLECYFLQIAGGYKDTHFWLLWSSYNFKVWVAFISTWPFYLTILPWGQRVEGQFTDIRLGFNPAQMSCSFMNIIIKHIYSSALADHEWFKAFMLSVCCTPAHSHDRPQNFPSKRSHVGAAHVIFIYTHVVEYSK